MHGATAFKSMEVSSLSELPFAILRIDQAWGLEPKRLREMFPHLIIATWWVVWGVVLGELCVSLGVVLRWLGWVCCS